MNWGTKIIIGMLCFMSFIIVLAVLMFRSNTDALVDQDYYEKGLNYDETYRQKERVIRDVAKPSIMLSDSAVTISFKTSASGNIEMLRLSDKSRDKKLVFSTNTYNQVSFPMEGMAAGRWKLIIRWTAANADGYLSEQEIYIP